MDKRSKAVVALLAAWPDSDDELMERALASDSYYTRHNAADVLDKRKVDYDHEALGILDLEKSKTCTGRAQGLRRLKKHGKSQRAIETVKRAGARQPDNLCMVLEFGAAESAIKSRL